MPPDFPHRFTTLPGYDPSKLRGAVEIPIMTVADWSASQAGGVVEIAWARPAPDPMATMIRGVAAWQCTSLEEAAAMVARDEPGAWRFWAVMQEAFR